MSKDIHNAIEPLAGSNPKLYQELQNIIKKHTHSPKVNNSIFSLTAYRHNDMWVFDDEERGLVKEPFVHGADTMFDFMSGNVLPGVNNTRCSIAFSANPMLNNDVHVKHIEDLGEDMGDIYEVVSAFTSAATSFDGFQFWLCPALLSFFDKAPENIYVSVTSAS
tara:strand:- start:334 stop:825 length:492 start_codon:yes stop_codon:yes gene_type:complete